MSDLVTKLITPVRLAYTVTAGGTQRRFLEGLQQGRILGGRCDQCRKVYCPPRSVCPTCTVVFPDDAIELAQTGTVTTFCVVRIPHEGQKLEVPYVAASILLDGADIPLFHLISDIGADDVRMGMRVEAVWNPPAERLPGLESIAYFRPNGEADAPFERYAEHL